MSMGDLYTTRQLQTIERAAVAATLAIGFAVTHTTGFLVPFDDDDREKIESFIRETLAKGLKR